MDNHISSKNNSNEITATYPYFDQAGQLIAEKVRSIKYPKGIWRRPDGKGGWIYNRQGVPIRCMWLALWQVTAF